MVQLNVVVVTLIQICYPYPHAIYQYNVLRDDYYDDDGDGCENSPEHGVRLARVLRSLPARLQFLRSRPFVIPSKRSPRDREEGEFGMVGDLAR